MQVYNWITKWSSSSKSMLLQILKMHCCYTLKTHCKSVCFTWRAIAQRRMTLNFFPCEANELLTKIVSGIGFSFWIIKRSLRAFQKRKITNTFFSFFSSIKWKGKKYWHRFLQIFDKIRVPQRKFRVKKRTIRTSTSWKLTFRETLHHISCRKKVEIVF